MESNQNNFDFKDYKTDQKLTLRQYQFNLLETAKKQNTIIYLPTGGGKTLIALHVLLSRSHEITRVLNEGGKRAFFLANTKVLVYQLASSLKTHTKFKIGCYTGDMNVDSWDMLKWQSEIKKNHVLVLTAEILRQILVLKFFNPLSISLIVFDECHHANQNHPYKQIMDIFRDEELRNMPLILGLSATLFKTSPKKNTVEKLLQALENTYRAKIVGGQDWNNALTFTGVIREKIIHFDRIGTPSLQVKCATDIYNEAIQICTKLFIKIAAPEIPEDGRDFKKRNGAVSIRRHLDNANKLLEELGPYCGSLAALYYTIVVEKQRLLCTDNIETQALIFARTTFHKIRRLLSIAMGEEESSSIIYEFSSPKVQKMIDLILDIHRRHDKPTILFFVHKRATAIILAYMMKRLEVLDPQFSNIKSEFVIGSSIFSKTFYIPLKSNEEILKRFATHELNLLFSTNVLEEGIDIPACNFVVSFDFPLGYSSYIQSKGRARDQSSQYYVFCESQKGITALEQWTDIAGEVKQTVASEDYLLEDSSENSTMEEYVYITTKTGGEKKIDGITAIKAVERYCTFLMQDLFACLTPVTWYKENNLIKTAFLQLPVGCPLRQTIVGEGKANLKLAKKSVYLKTVKLLHEKGLIDDNLCFVDHEVKDVSQLFPHYERDESKKLGTKKRRRVFNKKVADCISNCLPTSGKKLYLHVINLSPIFSEPLIKQKLILYDLIKAPCTYGLLSTKKLPKICEFPLFLDLGKLNCNILENYDTFTLTDKNIADIKSFHYALFKQVLSTVKTFHLFDNCNGENSYFIVALRLNEGQRFQINWDIICSDFCKRNSPAVVPYNPTLNETKYPEFPESYETSLKSQGTSKSLIASNASANIFLEQENKKRKPEFIMNEEEYLNFVICPNYRCISPPQYYCVTQCCHNLSPKSPFPREEFDNYYDYYRRKYGKTISNLDQPLLRVTHIPNCSNFNNPLCRSRKSKQIKDYQEYFVPELCDILRFPPKYWIKAQFLPTVLNRISHMYLVEELRKRIATDTGFGITELPANIFWRPLIEDVEDKEKEDAKVTDFNKFLNQMLPLSVLKNKTEDEGNASQDLERKLFDISACDLENYMESFTSNKEDFYCLDSLERTEAENELNRLHAIRAPTLNLLNRRKTTLGPELSSIVQACSTNQANDMINYERLEILGDSFLKLASSFLLFKKFKEAEGFLTVTKSDLLSNRNLMYCALKKNLDLFINTYDFSPLSDWNPPLMCIPEKLKKKIILSNKDPVILHRFDISEEEQFSGFISSDTLIKNLGVIDEAETIDADAQNIPLLQRHVLSDKVLADVVEAITGAFIYDCGLEGGLTVLKWFNVLPEEGSSFEELFKESFQFKYLEEGNEEMAVKMLEEKLVSSLEETLGYSFINKGLLLEALTHPSCTCNRITLSFQRLEFLGDAVLDFLVTVYIYENFHFNPGKITDLRAAVVNNLTFGCLSIKYDFHKYMLSMCPPLNNCIEACVKFQISRNHAIGEHVLLVQEESSCVMAETVSFPKALGDIFESIAGAIFLDSGNSLETVWNIYYKFLKNVLDDFADNTPKPSTRLLYEIINYKPNFNITVHNDKIILAEADIEYKDYEIKIRGFGKNKSDAILSACKYGLQKIIELKK